MSNDQSPHQTPSSNVKRKLTAILAADVQGYSRLMGADEVATLQMLTAYRVVTDALIAQHHGRIVNTAGDSILAEFGSVVDAVQCAVEIQRDLNTKNVELPAMRRMLFRIGINLGDVMVEGEQIYGDGVNIAARLENLADGGGICIAGNVYEQVRNKLPLQYEDLGAQRVKNIAEPIRIWRVKLAGSSLLAEQASSLHAARMAAPLEGQGEGVAREARGSRFQVQSAKSATHGAGNARWFWGIAAGLFLVAGIVGAVWHFARPILSTQDSALRTDAALAALPLPDKPSIVILPFVNMSEDPQQDYFSDGITEDLTSALSKISRSLSGK